MSIATEYTSGIRAASKRIFAWGVVSGNPFIAGAGLYGIGFSAFAEATSEMMAHYPKWSPLRRPDGAVDSWTRQEVLAYVGSWRAAERDPKKQQKLTHMLERLARPGGELDAESVYNVLLICIKVRLGEKVPVREFNIH